MAMTCPKCGKGTLKKGEKMVYCTEYKPHKNENGEWVNEGTCEFRIMYKNKVWGEDLTSADIKELVQGNVIVNARGDTMKLDLDSEFFTKIEKKEDEDL